MTWALNVCWSSGRFDSFAAVMPSGTVSAGSDCPGSRAQTASSAPRSCCILPTPPTCSFALLASSCSSSCLIRVSASQSEAAGRGRNGCLRKGQPRLRRKTAKKIF
jgi:hypothetical protein